MPEDEEEEGTENETDKGDEFLASGEFFE